MRVFRPLVLSLLLVLGGGITALSAQNREVSGKVLDANQQPLVGVAVLVDGTTRGTTTSENGSFTLDIPAGDVRVKVGGGHAGHNGLRSIIDKMGSRDFSRIRTGIGNPPGKMAVADYVLKQLRAREAEDFQDTCARAADAAGLAIVHGVIYARDHVNGSASANGKH